MKRLVASVLLVGISAAFSGMSIGCSASAGIEPDRSRPASSRDDSYYKKTETRDANGNLVERKVETRHD